MSEISNSDRAALIFVGEIPDGEYNAKVEAIATSEGIEIDNYIVILVVGFLLPASISSRKTPQLALKQSPVTPRSSPEHEP